MIDTARAQAGDSAAVESELIDASLNWLEALSPEDLFPLIPATVLQGGVKAACLLLAPGGQTRWRAVSESGTTRAVADQIAAALSSRTPLADQAECYDLPLPPDAFAPGEDRLDVHILRLQAGLLGALAIVVARETPAPVLPSLVIRHAAIALSNALQFEELSTRSEGLAAITQFQSTVDLDCAFENVLTKTITRVPALLGATKAGVLLYDPAAQKLRLQAPAFGFFEGEMVEKYQVTVDTGGVAWGVFASGKPYLGNSCPSDPGCRQEIISLFGLTKMICVPLAHAGRRIGVLIVANRFDRDFTEEDVEVLDILSSHIGATLDNARLMEEETRRTAELERLNVITREQHDDLQRLLAMHLELNQRALAGTGIPGVAERVSRLIRRPLSVLDHFGSLVYRTHCTDAQEEALVQAEQSARERDLKDAGSAGTQPGGGSQPAIAADITGGDQHLGCLVVASGEAAMSRSEAATIEYARSIFALEMLKQRAVQEVERRLQGEFISDLLMGSAEASTLIELAYRFGHDLTIPHWVMSLRPTECKPSGTAPGSERRSSGAAFDTAFEQVQRWLTRILPTGRAYPRGKGFVLLVAAVEEKGRFRPPSLGTAKADLEKELRTPLLVGTGTLCTSTADYPRAWSEAELSVELGSKVAPGRSEFTFRDLGVYRLLSQVEDGGVLREFRDDALGALIAHDRQHNDRLLPTLVAFLASGGVLKAAAANLKVHENTLRHRLRRIESVLAVDLDSTTTRTELDLALKIHGAGMDAASLIEH